MRFLIGKKKILLYTVLVVKFKGQYFQRHILAANGLLEGKLELVSDWIRNKGKEKDLNLNNLHRRIKSIEGCLSPEVSAALP